MKKIGVNSFKVDAGRTTGKKVHRSSTENGSSRIKPTSSQIRENIKLISQHHSALSKRISKKNGCVQPASKGVAIGMMLKE